MTSGLWLCAACPSNGSGTDTAASPTASATTAQPVKLPLPKADIDEVVNPSGLAPYAGPTGTVKGVVRLSGDPVPKVPELSAALPVGKCLAARSTYQALLREGPKRELADALVAVTEYQGWVQAKSPGHLVESRDCAFDRRTIAFTYGQVLQVKNQGPEAVIPQLVGVRSSTLLVALPGGPAIELLAPKPGQYRLVDQSHPFASAEVFVLAYPTTDVTDTSGQFEITGIPVGPAKLSVMIPVLGQTYSQDVTIDASKPVELVIAMPLDGPKLDEALAKVRSDGAAPSGSSKPEAP